MKYIIEFEDEYSMNEGGMKYHQCKQVPYWSVSHGIIKNLTPYTEPDRKAIEDEVWRFLVFLIDEMDSDENYECFGMSSPYGIVSTMSYREAKAKYESWLKQKDKIRVGDEVTPRDGTWSGIVVDVDNGDLTIMGKKGISANGYESKFFSKTGRHFPEVAELLQKMRGEQE